ncbi:MAG: Stp1/IreP family PP2C-type Ser/Thr phosphatase [Defluviitaleaceae bacterium]|nr:Stp1/IreP family PP2C-type Ser/Thr phosphatase [Defluviitaleaceae bacterium]
MYANGLTDTGITRSQNQDAIFWTMEGVGPLPNLFIVADGMGGHKAGDIASNQAIALILMYIENFPAAEFVTPADYLDLMVNAAQTASDAIATLAEKEEEMQGMGTTLTMCVIVEGEKAIIAHIGDSRAYAITEDDISQLTIDHTYVHELLQAGKISEAEARNHPQRNVITRALGTPGRCELDGYTAELFGVESLLLCSDGLSNMIDDENLWRIVSSEGDTMHRLRKLIKEANNNGGKDNISAVLIDLGR